LSECCGASQAPQCPSDTRADLRVLTGCMACHSRGIAPRTLQLDELRMGFQRCASERTGGEGGYQKGDEHLAVLPLMDIKMLKTRLQAARSRGEVKALGSVLDQQPEARQSAEALARSQGLQGIEALDGKRLVRALLDRSSGAQVRTNPIRRDEGFECAHCGCAVTVGGAMVRDHCPACLRSLHVDEVPGDRASECGGILDPVDLTLEGRAGVVITYKCRRCGVAHRNRAHPDDRLPQGLRLSEGGA